MKTYSLSYREVLNTPKKVFFWMLNQAHRIDAEEDLRMLRVLAAVNSNQEGYNSISKGLTELLGVTLEYKTGGSGKVPKIEVDENGLDPEFDREALRALKARHGA